MNPFFNAPVTHSVTDNVRGLYTLKKDGDIIYVGMTKNWINRIGQHLRGPLSKQFNSVTFYSATVDCTDFDLRIAEAMTIQHLDPPMNRNDHHQFLTVDNMMQSRLFMHFHEKTLL